MDTYAYQSFEESRTANRQTATIKSTQSWKNKKSVTQSEINASLNEVAQKEKGNFKTSLNKTMAYAPQSISTHNTKQEGFQFNDVIDIVNPLHHLPIVGTIYRNITGDELHPLSGIIGGGIYGGPIGALTGTVNAVSKIQTGKDLGEHAFSLIKSETTENTKQITMFKEEMTPSKTYSDDITTLTLAAMPPPRT